MTSKQLTQRVEEALAAAHGQAVSRGNASLEPAHVALEMVQAEQSLLSQLALAAVGDKASLRDALAALVNDLPTLGSRAVSCRAVRTCRHCSVKRKS